MRDDLLEPDYWGDLRVVVERIIPEEAPEHETALRAIESGETNARYLDNEDEAELFLKMVLDLIFEHVPPEGIEEIVVSATGRPLYFSFAYEQEKPRADHEQFLMDELERRLE